MLLIVLVTSFLAFIILTITSIIYLISVICGGSDDIVSNDALAIDAHDFSTTPTVSPTFESTLANTCANPAHHHHVHGGLNLRDATETESMVYLPSAPHSKEDLEEDTKLETATRPKLMPQSLLPDELEKILQQPPVTTNKTVGPNCAEPATRQPVLPPATWDTSALAQKSVLANHLGAVISKQVFDDFDAKEMQFGGNGLHWCKTRKTLDRLVRLGLPLNAINGRHETALHVAVRKRKLPILIGLLCYGADVECKNTLGETALILASKMNDIFASQLLLIFDSRVDARDNQGFSARHYVASSCEKHKSQLKQPPSAAHLILAMLSEMGALRCSESNSKAGQCNPIAATGAKQATPNAKVISVSPSCSDGCMFSGKYNGNSYNRWPDFSKESLYKRHMFSDIIEEQKRLKSMAEMSKQNTGKATEATERRSRLLCIDGGGMRGVLVCQIMIEMEKYLKKPMMSYFDWIGGTSAGAFMACALCTGTSLRQLRRITFDVKDEVFCGNKPYNSKSLERVLKRTFGPNTRMSDVKGGKKLAVTTVIADRDPCQLRFFRNYKAPADILEQYGYSADMFDNMSGHSTIVRKPANGMNNAAAATTTKGATIGNVSVGASKIAAKSSVLVSFKSSIDFNGQKRSSLQKEAQSESIPKTRATKETANHTQAESKALPKNDANPNTIAKQASVISLDEDDSIIEEATTPSNLTGIGAQADYVIDENEQDPLVWQAVRASGAAPFFFKPYGPYLDGGLISNNPTLDMLTEFSSYERVKSFLRARVSATTEEKVIQSSRSKNRLNVHDEPPSKLSLVVSLGTGRARVIGRQAMVDVGTIASGFATVFSPVELLRSIRAARDIFKKLMQQSCHTEDHILDRAQAWCSSLGVPYFRINPPLATFFPIDDKRDEQLINALWQTKLYMRAMSPQLEQLGQLL